MEFDNAPLSAIPHYLQPRSRSIRLLRNTREMATSDLGVPMSGVIQTLNNPGGTTPPYSRSNSPHSRSSAGSIENRLARLENQGQEREKELKGLAKVVDKVNGFEKMVDVKIGELKAAMDKKMNDMDTKMNDMGTKMNDMDEKMDKIVKLLQDNKLT